MCVLVYLFTYGVIVTGDGRVWGWEWEEGVGELRRS